MRRHSGLTPSRMRYISSPWMPTKTSATCANEGCNEASRCAASLAPSWLRVLPPFRSPPLRQFAERPGWRVALLTLHLRSCVHPCTRSLVVAVTTVGVGARGSNDRKFGCVLDSWRSVPICLGLRLLRWTPASASPTRLRVVACSRSRCERTTIAQDGALGGALQWRRLSSGTPE